MDIEIFVHGVPNGHDTWGKTSVEKYFDSFYGPSCNDERRYHIQVVQSDGKFFCYYNYLVYNNVQDYNGRSGSFIGLTVRMDGYCKDFSVVYSVLDIVFNAYLKHNIIEQDNNRWRYLVASFKEKNDILNSVYDATFHLLTQVLKKDNICSLNGFVYNKTSKLLSYNLNEVSNQTVEQIIRQYGQIILSPFYPTNKEREIEQRCNNRINELAQQYSNHIETVKASKDQEIQSYKRKIAMVEQQFNKRIVDETSKKDQEIRSLKDKLATADKECKERVSQAIQNKSQEINVLSAELGKKKKEVSDLQKNIQQLQSSRKESNGISMPHNGAQVSPAKIERKLKYSKASIISIVFHFILIVLLIILLSQIMSLRSNLSKCTLETSNASVSSATDAKGNTNGASDSSNSVKKDYKEGKKDGNTRDTLVNEDKKPQGGINRINNPFSQNSGSVNETDVSNSQNQGDSHGSK